MAAQWLLWVHRREGPPLPTKPIMKTIMVRSYAKIANSLDLWREYVDPDMAFSDEQFEAMSVDQQIGRAHV